MNSIIEAYQELNFSDYERKKLAELERRVITLYRLKEKQIEKRKLIEENIAEFEHDIRECWNKASKLQQRLQKRCKHNGGTYTREIYRDFGSDVIRTHCRQCQDELSSRRKDE